MLDTIREVFALRRNGYSGPFFQGLTVAAMGAWIIYPNNTFDVFEKYDLMAEFASEEAWGTGLIASSLIIIVGALSRKPREVALGSIIIGAAWLLMFASFFAVTPESTINAVAIVMVLRNASIFREFMTQFDPVTGKPYGFDSEGKIQ